MSAKLIEPQPYWGVAPSKFSANLINSPQALVSALISTGGMFGLSTIAMIQFNLESNLMIQIMILSFWCLMHFFHNLEKITDKHYDTRKALRKITYNHWKETAFLPFLKEKFKTNRVKLVDVYLTTEGTLGFEATINGIINYYIIPAIEVENGPRYNMTLVEGEEPIIYKIQKAKKTSLELVEV